MARKFRPKSPSLFGGGPDQVGANPYFRSCIDSEIHSRSGPIPNDIRARFAVAAESATLPLTDGSPPEMPGQKRKRLTPGLSGFTKVGTSDGLNMAGLDSLTMPTFTCETPTLAPAPAPLPPAHAGAAAKLFRISPRLTASSGIFNSPMFSVQTPIFEYQSTPNVFHNSLLPPPFGAAGSGGGSTGPGGNAGSVPLHADHLLSPVPFMESPYTQHDLYHHHHHQQQQHQQHPQQQQQQMELLPRLSLTGTQPQNSVLERFRKFFDNQGGPADFGSPSICAVSQPVGDAFSLGMPYQRDVQLSPRPPPPPQQQQQHEVPPPVVIDDEDVSSGDSNDLLSPSANAELSESLLRSGSSCHQCKSRRMQGYLSFCSGAKAKRKSCRKKYCDACLAKFYHMQPSRSRSAKEQTLWSCPSCRGICCCAACRRSKVQQQTTATNRSAQQPPFAKTPELYSPATSMAVGLVYFGDFDLLDGSVPIQLPPPALRTEPPPRARADSLAAFGTLH